MRVGFGQLDGRCERFIVDDDFFCGGLGLVGRLGDDDGHWLAGIARDVLRNNRKRRREVRATIGGSALDQRGIAAKAIGRSLLPRQDRHDAWTGKRGGMVDTPDSGGRMRRAQDIHTCRARQRDVIGKQPLAAQQPSVFRSRNRLPDTEFCHVDPVLAAAYKRTALDHPYRSLAIAARPVQTIKPAFRMGATY